MKLAQVTNSKNRKTVDDQPISEDDRFTTENPSKTLIQELWNMVNNPEDKKGDVDEVEISQSS